MEARVGADENEGEQTVIHSFPIHFSVRDVLQEIGATDSEDAFYIVNPERLIFLYNQWCDLLPSVKPFYAVKCNTDPLLLQTLAALGSGFDCASKNEIATILDLGVDPSRIIYANTCKQASYISYAAEVGINLMTFDNEAELHKIKEYFPTAELVLRIVADDPTAVVQLGIKFGVELDSVPDLLSLAKTLDLNVVGVSFHIGSRAKSADAYAQAIAAAKEAFIIAEKLGFSLTLLDIGGGFPGDSNKDILFREMVTAIRSSLATLLADYHGLRVIAEPGRYFACSTHALAVNIIGKKCKTIDSSKVVSYYINDGVYGTFKHQYTRLFTPKVLKNCENVTATITSIIWGPTCATHDRINDTFQLPELNIDDWLYYEDIGDYTVANHASFDGFSKPLSYYWCTDKGSKTLKKLLGSLVCIKEISSKT